MSLPVGLANCAGGRRALGSLALLTHSKELRGSGVEGAIEMMRLFDEMKAISARGEGLPYGQQALPAVEHPPVCGGFPHTECGPLLAPGVFH